MLFSGCLLDIAPARDPLDAAWTARMLAGERGQWFDGAKSPYVRQGGIDSSPIATNYRIDIIEQGTFGGGWSIIGGMVGQAAGPDSTIELFGKQIARTHGLKRNAAPRDYSFEFFLVVRPKAAQQGRLIKQWQFSREALSDRPPSDATPGFPGPVDAHLSFDERSKTATVTIAGLVRPFQERVDLSRELP